MSKKRINNNNSTKNKSESETACTAANVELTQGISESDEEYKDRLKLKTRLNRIEHKIVVLSGKGGVGKSTIAVNLAVALSIYGNRVGLLDIDIHGPSVPTMLGLEKAVINASDEIIYPVDFNGMKVMSLGFLLRNQSDAVIWRGPLKMSLIKQFLKDVDWGELDYLIIDSPPGTGDEPLSICQLIGKMDGAVIVTTPQKISSIDVKKSITFCKQLNLPVIGVVENMNGFVCPKCGEITNILPIGGGKQISEEMNVPFLGSLPLDPQLAMSCDQGQVFIQHFLESPTAKNMKKIIQLIARSDEFAANETLNEIIRKERKKEMRIAVPLSEGVLTIHFGHCESFALVDVDPEKMKILYRRDIEAPPHEPGLLPVWLKKQGVDLVIAGGIGERAIVLLKEQGVSVVTGAQSATPETLINEYLSNTLQPGDNACDH